MVDILIPTYNRPTRLETALYALTLQDPPLPDGHRLIICDDHSPIPAETVVGQFKPKLNIELHRMEENVGTSAVRRFLIKQIQQKFVLWLDDDVVLHPKATSMHLTGCSQPNPGISVGTMEDVGEDITDEILTHPLEERITLVEQKAMPDARRPFKDPWNYLRAWGACWTGNLMMLKEHGDSVGWLDDEAVGWGHDDTIMTAKLIGSGVRVWYDVRIRGWHLRQDKNRTGNLGRNYWDTAKQNALILNQYLHKYGITWDGG